MRDAILSPEDLLRFESSYDMRGPDECWPWLKYVPQRKYPYFRFRGQFVSARRLAWELSYGPVPDGMVVRPLCGERSCMNPSHFEVTKRNSHPRQIDHFWSQVDRRNGEDCWNWLGATDVYGYGQTRFDGMRRAHRVAWTLTNGTIPEGMMICHQCDNRKCCNPKHLSLGSNEDNLKDMARKGRSRNRHTGRLEAA